MNHPPLMRYILTHLWGTLTCPIHPYGAHSDSEHMLPLEPTSCPSFPSGHIPVLAPPGGPLSVCSGPPFLYPWNQTSESSELKDKMDTQDGMCYSSLFNANKICNWALRCCVNRQMEKNGEDKLALISAESLNLLFHPPIHFQTIMEWYDCERMS